MARGGKIICQARPLWRNIIIPHTTGRQGKRYRTGHPLNSGVAAEKAISSARRTQNLVRSATELVSVLDEKSATAEEVSTRR